MNQFKIKPFVKHLLKNKQFSVVTILGFSISLTFILLLSGYVKQELSVDHFHEKKDRIYRLVTETGATFCPPFGNWLSDLFPEVESYTRLYNGREILVDAKGEKHQVNFVLVDTTFFDIFSFPVLEGNASTCLDSRNKAVLSKSYANKIFPNQSAIGEIIQIHNQSFAVSAVIEDFGSNTQIHAFDAMLNFPVLADFWESPQFMDEWGNCSFTYYVLAKENTDLPAREADVLAKCKEEFWLFQREYAKVFKFELLTDAYFSSYIGGNIRQNSKMLVMILLSIVAFILILSIINYINLSVAQTSFRAKEAAIKKLMGGTRIGLFTQFIIESIFLTLVAAIIAFFLALLVEPWFNQVVETQLSIMEMFSTEVLVVFIGMIVFIAVISGVFPAYILSKFNPIEVVKGSFRRSSKGTYTKLLISFQYIVVIVLLVSTITVYLQSDFMVNYDLGYNKDNIIMIENTIGSDKKEALKNEWMKIPGVEQVSFVAGSPLDGGNNQSFAYNEKPVSFQEFIVDSAFFQIFGIEYTPTASAYSENGIFLNQKTIDNLGLAALPLSFKRYEKDVPVIGVLKDFHFDNLHQELGMLMIRQMKEDTEPWQMFIKITGSNLEGTVDQIEEVHARFSGGNPINLKFIDEEINSWYQTERNSVKIVGIFAFLSIILSVMGLMAISSYFIQQRVKEIGVRKVNGATIKEVILMLNWVFLKWVIIAMFIAIPLAYYAMSRWLENFVYRVELTWLIFFVAALAAFVIALFTITWQSRAAAKRNPVESLRFE